MINKKHRHNIERKNCMGKAKFTERRLFSVVPTKVHSNEKEKLHDRSDGVRSSFDPVDDQVENHRSRGEIERQDLHAETPAQFGRVRGLQRVFHFLHVRINRRF